MRLAAIYNVFDGEELLEGSIKQILPLIDVLIIVYQEVSNHGICYMPDLTNVLKYNPEVVKFTPNFDLNPTQNEKAKRQLGVNVALQAGYTHFVHLDCDEYYDTVQFKNAKDVIERMGIEASALSMYTYFQKPTLRLKELDNYYVPFIHKLGNKTKMGYPKYPYYVDPTRSVNTDNVYYFNPEVCVMHHFSWVRKNIDRKIKNSSARKNIEKSNLLKDYNSNLTTGSYLKDYKQTLIEVPDLFNLGHI